MILQLPSKKVIETDGISQVDSVSFHNDNVSRSWAEYDVIYRDGCIVPLYYDTEASANRDKNFLEDFLKKNKES